MDQEQLLKLFDEKNAKHEGHFLLSSGLHSATYLQTALILQHPDITEKIAKALIQKLKGLKIDCVAAPAVGGLVIGYEIARQLGVRFIFTERVDGKMIFRRGFEVQPGEKVLVADSVITTGGSPFEVSQLLKQLGAETVGIVVVVDRSGGTFRPNGIPVISLMEITVETFTPNDCPLCQQKIPLVKPGSRK